MAKAKSQMSPGVRFISNDCNTEFTLADGYEFKEFHLLSECKFSILKPSAGFTVENFESVAIPSGTIIKAPIVSFKLNSGTLIVYFGPIDEKAKVE